MYLVLKSFVFLLALCGSAAASAEHASGSIRFEPLPSGAVVVRGAGHPTFLERGGSVIHDLSGARAGLNLHGGASVAGTGEVPLTSYVIRYRGEQEKRTQEYSRVRFNDVYDNIDVVWMSTREGLRFDMIVAPNGKPSSIRLAVAGASPRIDKDGALVLSLPGGQVLQYRKPLAWQDTARGRIFIPAAYRLTGRTARFDVGRYDPSLPLVIDPTVNFAALVGGGNFDASRAAVVDSGDNTYIAGSTASSDFPGGNGRREALDAFVTKLSPAGSVLWTVILSGNNDDIVEAIALTASGVVVVGQTASTVFPSSGPGRTVAGGTDAFVVQITSAGAMISTFLLGTASDEAATSLSVDTSGSIYVGGWTRSGLFPVTAGAPQTNYGGGEADGFLARLASSGLSIEKAGYVGGSGIDTVSGIAHLSDGSACISASSNSINIAGASNTAPGVTLNNNGVVACTNAAWSAWRYLRYAGGSSEDILAAITATPTGDVYVTGSTASCDFPVTPGRLVRRTCADYDIPIMRLDPSGATVYSVVVAGSHSDSGLAISVRPGGGPIVGGMSASTAFPSCDNCRQGTYDALVFELNTAANGVLYSMFMGGALEERITAVRPAGTAGVTAAGWTASTQFSVPGRAGALSPAAGDAFVVRWSDLFRRIEDKTGAYRQGVWYLLKSGGVPAPAINWGAATSIPVPANWSGDGIAKVAVFDAGTWYIDENGDGVFNAGDRVIAWGNAQSVPVAGDWAGQNRDRVGVFTKGTWNLDVNGDGVFSAGDLAFIWGTASSIPLTGDWNGNGRTKVGVFLDGYWYLDTNGSTAYDAGDVITKWGTPASIPVTGDWNGDGRTKIGVVENGVWYLDFNGSGIFDAGDHVVAWGFPGATPVVGDWNGDGRDDIGVYDGGIWRLDSNGSFTRDSGDLSYSWGVASDRPVTGTWQ